MDSDLTYKVSFITTLHPKRDAGTETVWCIAKVYNLETGTQLTIKGILPGSYRRPGEEFTIEKATAPFTSPQYPKSPTVEFKACHRDRPIGKHGVVKFLKKADGIGAAYAERIWGEFGENTIQAILEQPQDVADRCGISLDTVVSASRQLRDEYDIHGHMLPILDLLVKGGISDRFVRQVMGLRLADPPTSWS